MHYPFFVWGIEREQWDVDLEGLPLRSLHLIRAEHHARRRLKRRTALVLEALTGTQNWLLTDYTRTFHFDGATIGVDDAPVTRAQLNGGRPAIFDHHGVGPEVVTVVGRRLVRQIRRLDRNGNLTRDTPKH